MIRLVKRLLTEFRTRGPAGFMRFLALRVGQWRADVLYEADLSLLALSPLPESAIELVRVGRDNLGSSATRGVEDGVLTAENHAYREALTGDDQLFATVDPQGQVISYGFVLFDSFYKRILGEARATPMIGNCFTWPAWRGRSLYPRLLMATCRQLAAQGHRRVIITCAPDNHASIRGIEKAGFTQVRTVRSLVVFARWIAWQHSMAPKSGVQC